MDINQTIGADVRPPWDCTGPEAVARAVHKLPGGSGPEGVNVAMRERIYKNGMHVGLPGTDGARGNPEAAVPVALCSREDHELGALRNCSACDVQAAEETTEAAATIGMAYLFGCDATRIPMAAPRILTTLGGMSCDESNETCARRVGAVGYEAHLMARLTTDRNTGLGPRGVQGENLDETMAGLANFARKVMSTFDSLPISLLRARAEQVEARRRANTSAHRRHVRPVRDEEDQCSA